MRDRGDPPQTPPAQREVRPFPAIDPEPDRRYTWRTLLRAAIAVVAACAVAAAVVAGARLAARHSGPVAAPARFTDSDGLIVFEQQPSGLLGTARPDGAAVVLDQRLGALQGNDLAVASPGGRYLVNQEAQLVTLGADGPVSITPVTPPNAQAQQSAAWSWMPPTFADGGRYLAVTECEPVNPRPGSSGTRSGPRG